MGLYNLYQTAKKKITDTVMPFEQKAVSGLGSLYQKAKGAVSNDVQGVKNYFGNDATYGGIAKNTFKPSSLSDSIMNAPKYTFANDVSWRNPAQKLGSEVLQGTLNTFHGVRDYTKEAANQYYGNNPADTGKLVGLGGKAALDLAGLGIGGNTVKNVVRASMKTPIEKGLGNIVWQGAKQSMKPGALFGGGYAASDSIEKHQSPINTAVNTVVGAGAGALAAGVVGGGISSVAPLTKMGVQEVKNIGKDINQFKNPYTKKIVPQVTQTPDGWVKAPKPANLVTREAVMGNRGKYNYKEPSFIDTVKTPFVPQSGTAKFIMSPKAGMGIEDVSLRPKSGTSPIIDQKNADAQAVVQKQLENQRVASPVAEKGFVSPQAVQAPQAVKQPTKPMSVEEFNANNGKPPVIAPQVPLKTEQTPKVPTIEEFVQLPSEKQQALTSKKADVPFEGNPFDKGQQMNFNRWQEKAYQEKGDRIKSIGEILNTPREIPLVYGKKAAANMSAEDAAKRVSLIRLGYPKDAIEKIINKHGDRVIEQGIPYERFPQHLLQPKKSSIPAYSQEEMTNASNHAKYMAETGSNVFKNVFKKWIGQREVAKTKGYEIGAKYKDIPQEMGWDVITAMEHPNEQVSKQSKFIATELRGELDNLHNQALNNGIDVGYVFDYIPHMWKETPEQVAEAFKGAGQKFGFSNKRVLPTYREGLNIGLTPKYNHPAQILAEYQASLEKTRANISLLSTLRNNGVIVDASVASRNPGFVPIIAPGFPKSVSTSFDGEKVIGEFYAPKEVANTINRVFGATDETLLSKIASGGAKASSTVQDITMSGGIPKTPLNAFTIANMTKEMISGRFIAPVKSFFRSMSGKSSDNFFQDNIGQIQKMQERNIPINTTLSMDSLGETSGLQKALTGGDVSKWETVKNVWNKSMNEPTFKRFMPMLQVHLFNDIEKKALARGKSAQEAADIAGGAVKNFYGLVGTDVQASRDKLGSNIVTTLAFAPRYREAMINFWLKNVKALSPVTVSRGEKWFKPNVGLTNPLTLENQTNIRFSIGALALYAGYDYMNKALNGHHIWDNPSGKEDKLLIPGQDTTVGVPYLSSIATVPRAMYREGAMLAKGDISGAGKDVAQTYSSSLIKPFVDVLSNENYYGQPITKETDTPGEKLAKAGGHIAAGFVGHPWVKAAEGSMTGDTPAMTASKAFEMPFRFYNNNQMASGEFWDKYGAAKLVNDKLHEIAKTDQTKAAQFAQDNQVALTEYDNLKPMYSLYTKMKEDGNKADFGQVLRSSGAEGAQANNLPSGSDKYLNSIKLQQQKDDFMNSEDKTREVDGKFWYKNDAGEFGSKSISSRNKDLSISSSNLEMDRAQAKGDIKSWATAADKKMEAIDGYIATLDPSIDQSTIDSLTLEKENLVSKAEKFAEYGGFKKGKSYTVAENKEIVLYDAKLTHAVKKGDLSGWKNLAEQQINSLQKVANDPNRTETQRLQAENKIISLKNDAEKYAEYGGFTKPKAPKYVRTADFTALDASLARLKAPSMVGGTAGIAKSIFGSMPRIAKAQRKGLRRVRLT